MSAKTITEFTAATSVDPENDPLLIVDTHDTSGSPSGTTKKVTLDTLILSVPSIKTGTYTDPNGYVNSVPGSIYFDLSNTSSPVQWIKTTGTGSVGWI